MSGSRFRIPPKKTAPAVTPKATVVAQPVTPKATVVSQPVTPKATVAQPVTPKAVSVVAPAAPPVAPVVKVQSLVAAADAKIEQIRAQARADVEVIRELSRTIARAFHEIGQALSRLKDPLAYGSLGYKSFAELCERELSFSVAKADELAQIATQMTREEAVGVGQKKAIAVVRLCRATIEDDKPGEVAKGTVTLPDGKTFDVKKASARETEAVAKKMRRAARTSGRGVKQDEQSAGDKLEGKLRKAGLTDARVRVLGGAGKEARLRIDGIPIGGVGKLCKAICGKGR